MTLAAQQRKLLGLLRSTHDGSTDEDPYIQAVAASTDLLEARRNILLWRVYVLQRMCPLTFTLLKSRGQLGDLVDAFIRERNISPFRETQAPDFLDMLSTQPDLLGAIAQFERAIIRVREGASGPFVISWKLDPHSVLYSLAKQLPLDGHIAEGEWRIVVSPQESGLFRIERIT
jgi:hypothetical protein